MSLIIPPDIDTNPSAGGEHEFDIHQNEVIGGLGSWMGLVAVFSIVFGVLQGTIGLLRIDSLAGWLTVGEGVCLALIGGWLWGASQSFKQIVRTEGMDITLLMHALRKLRNVYTLQGVLMLVACLLLATLLVVVVL